MMDDLRVITSTELRKIQTEILKYFISVCQSKSIPYFMAYGSLLGAVRHQGFIPWDDDIDVMILREDIPSLVSAFSNSKKYKIINSTINNDYFSPLLKVYDDDTLLIQDYGQVEGINIGVYIDIFVLDNVPSDDIKRKRFFKKAKKLRFRWALSCRKLTAKSRNAVFAFFKSIISIPFKIIGYKHFATKYDQFASSCRESILKAIVVYGEGFEKEYVYPINELQSIEVPFEGFSVSIPKNYDAVLTKCYGNYMELPPASERKRHQFNAFFKQGSNLENDDKTTLQ